MFSIAIDGPAGAGKSTVAKRVAQELNAIYVDTGAMYRAIALYVIDNNIDINDEEAVVKILPEIEVSIKYEDGVQQIFLNGENVSGKIRTNEVSWAASTTSKYQEVRAKLLDLQRDLARKEDVVMDGRDIGSVVLPDASLKIFLTASAEVRAHRRYLEMIEKGQQVTEEEVLVDIKQRDEQDSTRENAPLKQVEDAILVDSSDLTIDEVVNQILTYANERKGE